MNNLTIYNFKDIFIKNRQIILLAILILSPFISNAQTIFDKYENDETVKAVVVNKKMFDLMSKVKMEADTETQKYLNLIKKLDNLKVFVTTSSRTTADMRLTAEKYLKSSNLDELMRVNEGGKSVKIYIKSAGSDTQVKELLMYIEDQNNKASETVLMSLTGNFDINELSSLTSKMNIPGGNELNKASKK
jgi:hypothetical protein